jgi:hypothetical protein
VEHIYLGPDVMLERRITIDFTVPTDTHVVGATTFGRPLTYLPISVLRKWPPVMKFDLRDELDRPVPLFTTRQVARIDAAALTTLAERVSGRPLPTNLDRLVRTIALSPPRQARRAFNSAFNPRPGASHRAVRERLANDQRFADLAAHLVDASVVWAPIPAEPGRRRIIKLCYSIPAENQLDLLRTLFAQLRWTSVVFWFELPHIGDAASYHLHLEAQKFMEFTDARLLLPRRVAGMLPPAATHTQWNSEHAHLYATELRMRSAGLATIEMRVQRQGTVVGGWLATIAIAGLQWTFALQKDVILARDSIEAPVAVLILVPLVMVAFAARPTPRLHAQPVLLGFRALVNLAGLVSVAAAIAAVAAPKHAAGVAWWIAACVATAIAVATTVSVILPRGKSTGSTG